MCLLAMFLYTARLVIEEKIIGRLADPRKALELCEAMVMVEEVCERGGYDTDLEDAPCGRTRLVRLAHELLQKVMMAEAA